MVKLNLSEPFHGMPTTSLTFACCRSCNDPFTPELAHTSVVLVDRPRLKNKLHVGDWNPWIEVSGSGFACAFGLTFRFCDLFGNLACVSLNHDSNIVVEFHLSGGFYSFLVGPKDFLCESFCDTSAVQNVPYTREIVHLSFRKCFRDASAMPNVPYARNCQLSFREWFRKAFAPDFLDHLGCETQTTFSSWPLAWEGLIIAGGSSITAALSGTHQRHVW